MQVSIVKVKLTNIEVENGRDLLTMRVWLGMVGVWLGYCWGMAWVWLYFREQHIKYQDLLSLFMFIYFTLFSLFHMK